MVTVFTKEPCSIKVTLFRLTIVTLPAELSNYPLRYTLYPQPHGDQGVGTSGQGGAHGARRLQLCMVQLVYTSPLTTYLSTKTIRKLHYLMRILMQIWLKKKIRLLKTNGDLVPPKYWRHHRAHHRITPSQWTLQRATRKNRTTTKMETKNYYGTITTPILMYTTIQLTQKNLSRCRFANTTLLQLIRIIITKMRRHWKRQALKKVVPDATTTCPSSVVPREQHRSSRGETHVALCVLVSFRCVLYGYVVVRTSS